MRRAVTEAGRRSWPVGGPVRLGLVILGVGFAGALAWASVAEIHGAVIASGSMELESRRQAIQHPDGGVVAALPVRDGSRVEAGAAILELDATGLAAERAILVRQLQEARARIDRLASEARSGDGVSFRDAAAAEENPVLAVLLAGERRLFENGRESLMQTVAQIGERKAQTAAFIEALRLQAKAVRDQLALIGGEVRDKQWLLGKDLVRKPEVSRLLREEARLRGVLGELEAEIARGRSALASHEIERLRLLAERREQAQGELRALQPREAELGERLRVVETRLSRLVLRAPMAGVVHGLRVFTVGGVIPAGTEVAAIVPEGVPLAPRVRVDAARIDEIRAGQEVTVVFPAFNLRSAPEFIGRVRTVSADALVDEASGTRYYTAEIVLDEDSEAEARARGIVPGMPVEAFIRTRARTPLAFLLDPFTDYVRHAFREE